MKHLNLKSGVWLHFTEVTTGDAVRAAAIVAQRGPQFFHPTSLLANIFHHRCRGASLPEELRSNALLHVNLLANQLGVSAPMLDEVIEFVQYKGKFREGDRVRVLTL